MNPSFKIVDRDFLHERLYVLGDKFKVLRMHLIIVLRLFAGEGRAQCDLIGLVHDGPVAANHLADVEMREAGDGLEKFVRAGNDGIGGFGFGGVGPENDDMGKHNFVLRGIFVGTAARASQELRKRWAPLKICAFVRSKI